MSEIEANIRHRRNDMSIEELKEAVNKSNMDTEARAEVCKILKFYVDMAELVSKGNYGD